MMSSWTYNCKLTPSSSAAYPCAMLSTEQEMPHKSPSSFSNTLLTNQSSSMKETSLIGNIWQKLTKMVTPRELPSNCLEKTKQSFSAPDIFVDARIRTPVFDTKSGKAELCIPEKSDRNMSLSLGNPPFEWNSVKIGMNNVNNKSKIRKRAELLSAKEEPLHLSVKNNRKTNRKQVRCKMGIKNLNEKNRHSLLVDVMEDYQQNATDSDRDSDAEFHDTIQNVNSDVRQNLGAIITKQNVSSDFSLFDASFPAIECAVTNLSLTCKFPRTQYTRQTSECDSEDSFVIFSEDVRTITPSASPKKQNNMCTTINNMFSTLSTTAFRRQREMSECSDDSIVFCYDSDYSDICCQVTIETGDDQQKQATRSKSSEKRGNSALSHQLDSGFEEKKVRFNLNPEVHIIRVWDFAYRQARKGEWETVARDRERFKKRIEEAESILEPVFDCNMRQTVFRDRFAS